MRVRTDQEQRGLGRHNTGNDEYVISAYSAYIQENANMNLNPAPIFVWPVLQFCHTVQMRKTPSPSDTGDVRSLSYPIVSLSSR